FFLATLHLHLAMSSFPTRRSSDLRIFSLSECTIINKMKVSVNISGTSTQPRYRMVIFHFRFSFSRLFCSNWSTLFKILLILFIRSEEHTSELQSRFDLVCRLLPEK